MDIFWFCWPSSHENSDVRRPGRARPNFMDSAHCPYLTSECNVLLSNLPRLTYAHLQFSQISDEGMPFLSEVFSMNTTIKGLNLSHNLICDEGAECLFKALEGHSTLTELNLSYNRMTDDLFTLFSTKIGISLREIQLSDNAFTDEGVCNLAKALSQSKTLAKLYLSNCRDVGDRSATVFAEALLQNTSLLLLELSHNRIGDTGAQAFADLLRNNKTLVTLGLGSNHISDLGGVALAEGLRLNSTLATIDLHHNRLTSRTALVMADTLGASKSLTGVNLAENDIAVDGVEALVRTAKARTTKTQSVVAGVYENPGTKFLGAALTK